jgi:hypothetical protein
MAAFRIGHVSRIASRLSRRAQAGFSGTVFRLQGGSLVEGEGAPFDASFTRYSILDGIRDGYLVPAFSAPADDKIDVTQAQERQGEYDGRSQDAQMLALMDNHIAQMIHHGARGAPGCVRGVGQGRLGDDGAPERMGRSGRAGARRPRPRASARPPSRRFARAGCAAWSTSPR